MLSFFMTCLVCVIFSGICRSENVTRPNICDGNPVPISVDFGMLEIDTNVNGTKCVWTFSNTTQIAVYVKSLDDIQGAYFDKKIQAFQSMIYLFDRAPQIEVTLHELKMPIFFEIHFNVKNHFELRTESVKHLSVTNIASAKQNIQISIRPGKQKDVLVFAQVVAAGFDPEINTNGDRVAGTMIQKDPNTTLDIILTVESTVDLNADYALQKCSGMEIMDQTVNFRSLTGSGITKSYRCLKLYELNHELYVELDFSKFVGLVDQYDSLSIIDAEQNYIVINKYNCDTYKSKIVSLAQGPFVVEYVSPLRVTPKIEETIIILVPRNSGGIVKDGPLKAPSDGVNFTRFIYTASTSNYRPQITLGFGNPLPKGSFLNIYAGYPETSRLLAEFTSEELHLPDTIVVDDTALVAEFKGDSLPKLSKKYSFGETNGTCNRLSNLDIDTHHFSLLNSSCTWLITPKSRNGTRLLYLWNLDKYGDGIIDIASSEKDELSLSLHGVYPYKAMPALALKSTSKYYLTAPRGAVFSATHSYTDERDSDSKVYNLTRGSKILTSIDYPNSYPLGNYEKDHQFVGSRYYLAIFDRVEMSEGDSFTLTDSKKKTVVKAGNSDDVVLEGSSSIQFKSTLKSGKIDLSQINPNERVYSVNVSAFDNYQFINDIKTNSTTSDNCNASCLFVMTSRPVEPFRGISFTILQENRNTSLTELLVYDDRSARQSKRLINNTKEQSSSDTIVIIYRFKDDEDTAAKTKNLTLPKLTIQYTWPECETKKLCDNKSRCIRQEWVCNGIPDCDDFADEKYCNGTQPVPPKVIETGMGGIAVFFLSLFTFIFGVVLTMYGPTAYHFLENYMRSGQYTTFVSE